MIPQKISPKLFILLPMIIIFFVKNSTCQDDGSAGGGEPGSEVVVTPAPKTELPRVVTTPNPNAEEKVNDSIPLILSEVKINLGDPCDYALYQQFVSDSLIKSISYILTRSKYNYVKNLSQLCVEVSSDSVVDAHKFDCVLTSTTDKTSICSCGYNMYKLDPLWSAPNTVLIRGVTLRTYTAINRLDRQLYLEKGKCVSGTYGHCTTDESRAEDMKLQCRERHSCKQTSTSIQNKNSSEWYFTCEEDSAGYKSKGKKGAKKSISQQGIVDNSSCPYLLMGGVVILMINIKRL